LIAAPSVTSRMPRPPPPADALRITGNPIDSATRAASVQSATMPSEPGVVRKPAAAAAARAARLVAHQPESRRRLDRSTSIRSATQSAAKSGFPTGTRTRDGSRRLLNATAACTSSG
jgi:hypothetical protein